ncbi:conserved Plasmodium protein, unknown function [Plasmodium gallinaceum]|uniref:RING-CH-type domain-containing protein n=1 Tax=Plasmodium gallinaceum TaxID=5849 RepID=A0A1J1GXK9_PLAGA|nr:conserved Plasmodium protein, unknown function [Plasmodium gallinaceum]CRG97030.1 conserved Plasmodium protein, unknown function [Plasmodium gallinaceum]
MESNDYFMLSGNVNLKEPYIKNNNSEDKRELFCFICLEKDLENSVLLSCCSLCTACVHKKCWFTWRKTQKLGSLRSKLLGLNKSDPLLCTICKTGISKIEEENDFNWIVNNNRNKEYLQDELLRTIASLLNNENNDNNIPNVHFKYILSFNFIFLIILIIFIIFFIMVFGFTINYVLLIALLILYEVIVVQIVLYIYIRVKYNSF